MRLVFIPERLHENRRAVDPAAGALALLALWYVVRWWSLGRARQVAGGVRLSFTDTLAGFATNSFDTLGIGPIAAFPIMMGSCAFLMPIASARFVEKQAYAKRPALGLALGGIPGVFVAAYVFTSLDIYWVRWLVVVVVLIAATLMLRSGITGKD